MCFLNDSLIERELRNGRTNWFLNSISYMVLNFDLEHLVCIPVSSLLLFPEGVFQDHRCQRVCFLNLVPRSLFVNEFLNFFFDFSSRLRFSKLSVCQFYCQGNFLDFCFWTSLDEQSIAHLISDVKEFVWIKFLDEYLWIL